MSSYLDLPIEDPQCGRLSTATIEFGVGGQRWSAAWGRFDAFGTPAYWVNQTVHGRFDERVQNASNFAELESEVVFCLLGGFGVTAESAAEAHAALMPIVADRRHIDPDELELVLRSPLGRSGRKYRFPHQRAERVAAAINGIRADVVPESPVDLHRRLLQLNGVGPKTAAWIMRNCTGSDQVAIIDIWLVRALRHCGVFPHAWDVRRDYLKFEQAFITFAEWGDVRPAALDLCIWEQARAAGINEF